VDYQERERLVLLSGLVAAGAVALTLLATIAGSRPGDTIGRLVTSLVLLYLCARIWGHASTLEERDRYATLGRYARLGAPVIFLLLLAQSWISTGISVDLSLNFTPHIHVSALTRLEGTADVAVFALFLLTATSVWIERSTRASAVANRLAIVLVGALSLDLLAGIWSVFSLTSQLRLVAALVVLSLAGTIVIGTLRRIERLDELDVDVTAESSAT